MARPMFPSPIHPRWEIALAIVLILDLDTSLKVGLQPLNSRTMHL